MQSLAGKLLVASSRLLDPNFAQSLVLIVRHDEAGALGVVLNRPLDVTIARMCQDAMDRECGLEGFLHQGGPCEGPLMVLHTHQTAADSAISEGLYFSSERHNVEWLVEHNDGPIRFFVNYSGWSPGQLEAEIETGSWVPVSATPERIFDESDDVWARIMIELSVGRPVDPRLIPPDPSVN